MGSIVIGGYFFIATPDQTAVGAIHMITILMSADDGRERRKQVECKPYIVIIIVLRLYVV